MAAAADPGAVPRLVPPGGKVCIVGGGTTGLLAAKNCIDEGLVPIVFERTHQVGGVWRLDKEPARVAYESLYTNSSGCLMNISDFPMKDDLQGHFPMAKDICDYYERYMDAFGLRPYVHFGKEVQSIRRKTRGGWAVVTVPRGDEGFAGEREEHVFDAVFVCTGQFREPLIPPLPNVSDFRGHVTHSAHYRKPARLVGKRVVLVGIGNSALDIALEAAKSGAASVVILCRAGTNIVPVADFHGRPADQMLNTRIYQALPRKLKLLIFLALVKGTNDKFRSWGMPSPPCGLGSVGFANLKEHVRFVKMLEEGRIRFASGGIAGFTEGGLQTTGGEELPADEVILCTGYRMSFPFLEPALAGSFFTRSTDNRVHLNGYRLAMHPSEPTLCALGFLLTFGNESCVGEMQSRWALAHWVGRLPLPSLTEIEVDLARRRRLGKYPQFVPYVAYMDTLAEACGAVPPLGLGVLLRDPRLFLKLWTGPAVPAQYRIQGAHSWAKAAEFVRSQPLTAQRWLGALLMQADSSAATPAGPPPASRL